MTAMIVEEVPAEDALWTAALDIVQRHTGYSRSDIAPDSEFEGDLGIDSVVLVSILGDFCEACSLKPNSTGKGLRTVADLVKHVRARLSLEGGSLPGNTRAPAAVSGPQDATEAVTAAFERHTGYDRSQLEAGAELQDDLGIDAVTLANVLEEIALALRLKSVSFPADLTTVGDVIAFFSAHAPSRQRIGTVDASQPNTAGNSVVETLEVTRNRLSQKPEAYPADDGDRRTMKDFLGVAGRDLFHKAREFRAFYRKKQNEQLYWYGMPLESRCQNRAVIYDEVTGRRREYLMFASNNYLGLANHPKVIEAIADAARLYGATNTGCRLIGGSNVLHKELERRLAKLKGVDDAIVYPSGYSANLGCISALAGPHDLIFTDAINHMSIQDGCKLSGASKKIYQHSIEALERILRRWSDHAGGKLIVTDGVFSMHGDIVDLPRLIELARTYEAKVLVDDAHATGVLGKTGSGTSEHFGMKGLVDLELGTFSKTLSGVGGFVAARGDVIEYLRFYSNSYVFAATIPAPVTAGLIASIDIMETEPERLGKLWSNIHHLRSLLLGAGFDLGNSASAIIPLVIGDDRKTLEFGRAVRARGMFCQTVVYPGVSVGDARLRISVTAEHTTEDLDLAADILLMSAKEVGIPLNA